MNRPFLFAFALASAGASPAFAADCLYLGTPSSPGALICQAGVISQCKAGHWAPTKKTCKVETALPKQTPVAAPAPAPAASQTTSIAPAAPPSPLFLLHVLTASYTSGNTGKDVVFAVRDLCDGKEACSFVGDEKFLRGDPAPRQPGRFSIIYECTTGFQSRNVEHVVFAKRATIALGCR